MNNKVHFKREKNSSTLCYRVTKFRFRTSTRTLNFLAGAALVKTLRRYGAVRFMKAISLANCSESASFNDHRYIQSAHNRHDWSDSKEYTQDCHPRWAT